MKNIRIKRAISFFLSVLFVVCLLSSCSNSLGEPVMTLKGQEITSNMYRFWLSRVKGSYGGSDDDIWDKENDDGKTYNEIFTEYVRQTSMKMLSAIYEFERLGLKLPESKINEIDQTMTAMLNERAEGDKATLNLLLADFGVNYNILREIYIIEAKLNYLQEHLYGDNGSEAISDEFKNEYYTNNYSHIKQIFFYTKNKPKTDENGKYIYDENKNLVTEEFTEEEIAAQKKKAEDVMTALSSGQEFDLLMTSQNEDIAADAYPNGYYFTRSSQYVGSVVEAAFELDENEFTMVESEYGIHIIKRLPLDKKGYEAKENVDFFSDFESNLRSELFTAYLSSNEKDIKIDEKLISEFDVKSAVSTTIY